jgi:hypothetical protein
MKFNEKVQPNVGEEEEFLGFFVNFDEADFFTPHRLALTIAIHKIIG